jgi:hypothetical protein
MISYFFIIMTHITLQTYDKYYIKFPIEKAFKSNVIKQAFENENYNEIFYLNNKHCTKKYIEIIFDDFNIDNYNIKNIIEIANYLDMNDLFQYSSKKIMEIIQSCTCFQDLKNKLNIDYIYNETELKKLEILFEHNKKIIHNINQI